MRAHDARWIQSVATVISFHQQELDNMAPSKFQIYVDQSVAQQDEPVGQVDMQVEQVDAKASRYELDYDQRRYPEAGELSIEEIRLMAWKVKKANEAHKQLEAQWAKEKQALMAQLAEAQSAALKPQAPRSRLSVVPASLEMNESNIADTTAINHLWQQTCDKFTVPIDQSTYIRDNIPTSTPTGKRRLSRPSMGGGSPTLKLSPITETSRDCNSKSSSSSEALSTRTNPQPVQRPVDPNDPKSYMDLLKCLSEPLERRAGYHKLRRGLPKIRQGTCFTAGNDSYLVDKELCDKIYTAQLLDDEDSSDLLVKTVCFRVDQPANEWLFYICNELHRRLVKQKVDIELSVMIANPTVMYCDGSILVDEYFRYVTLQHLIEACSSLNKPFPKSMAAYITIELIQVIRQIHACDIIHLDINPENILITCCPTREDIANVDTKTSIVKLIGFDRAMDMRLLPQDFKFENQLEDLVTCEMVDGKSWTIEPDWFGLLSSIHRMFYFEDMTITKSEDTNRWMVEDKQFKGFPTDVWGTLFDELLNIDDQVTMNMQLDRAIEELHNWVKANTSFLLKAANSLDDILEEYRRSTVNNVA